MTESERIEALERRIAELEGKDESSFGEFGRWDWWACGTFALVLPALALWWFAG